MVDGNIAMVLLSELKLERGVLRLLSLRSLPWTAFIMMMPSSEEESESSWMAEESSSWSSGSLLMAMHCSTLSLKWMCRLSLGVCTPEEEDEGRAEERPVAPSLGVRGLEAAGKSE